MKAGEPLWPLSTRIDVSAGSEVDKALLVFGVSSSFAGGRRKGDVRTEVKDKKF